MRHRYPTIRRRGPTGLTLVEVTLSSFIASVVIVAALNVVGGAARARAAQAYQGRAALLAEQLMTEARQQRFSDIADVGALGPETGESTGSRAAFDDVDDYRDWAESPPRNKDGSSVTGHGGWARQVAVDWVSPANPQTVSATQTDLKRVTVTVTDPMGRRTTLVGLRSRYGNYEQLPAVQTTYVSQATLDLTIGKTGTPGRVVSATNLQNQVPIP